MAVKSVHVYVYCDVRQNAAMTSSDCRAEQTALSIAAASQRDRVDTIKRQFVRKKRDMRAVQKETRRVVVGR